MSFMRLTRNVVLVASAVALAACEAPTDDNRIVDGGIDGGPLRDGLANIWVDPDGCQHWVIDDGIEGYMSPRLNRDGTPRCQDERGEIILKDGTRMATEQEPTA